MSRYFYLFFLCFISMNMIWSQNQIVRCIAEIKDGKFQSIGDLQIAKTEWEVAIFNIDEKMDPMDIEDIGSENSIDPVDNGQDNYVGNVWLIKPKKSLIFVKRIPKYAENLHIAVDLYGESSSIRGYVKCVAKKSRRKRKTLLKQYIQIGQR